MKLRSMASSQETPQSKASVNTISADEKMSYLLIQIDILKWRFNL